MNYPLISEYIEAIKSAEDNFEELSYLRPVLGDDGLPLMTSGNFAVVFKMKDGQNGKFYAVKCFTKEQEGRAEAYREIGKELENVSSPYILSIRYLEKELFVDTDQTAETEFPVLLMDWVEGKTLDKYLRDNLDDKYALEMLAYRFSLLAQWLIPQPFAHGDLKPDNILVREDGTLVLVDYDGMYVPAMKGQKARELGSPNFRHPQRTESDFNEHIDDFSLVSILFSLKVISNKPQLLSENVTSERLLLSERDYYNIEKCKLFKEQLLSDDNCFNKVCSLFIYVYSNHGILDIPLNPFLTNSPQSKNHEDVSQLVTEKKILSIVTQQDLADSWEDECGVTYSEDGTKLLKGAAIAEYTIKEGTIVICDNAFNELLKNKYEYDNEENSYEYIGEHLRSITIPTSVKVIGKKAFMGCKYLESISMSLLVEEIGALAFSGCDILGYSRFPLLKIVHGPIDDVLVDESPYIYYEDGILYNEKKTIIYSSHIKYDYGTSSNEGLDRRYKLNDKPQWSKSAWEYESRISDVFGYEIEELEYYEVIDLNIPEAIIEIGDYAFCGSEGIRSIKVPSSVKSIGEGAFANSSLKNIFFVNPNLVINRSMFGKARPHLFVPQGCIDIFVSMLGCKDDEYVEVFGWSGGIYEWEGKNMNCNIEMEDFESYYNDID